LLHAGYLGKLFCLTPLEELVTAEGWIVGETDFAIYTSLRSLIEFFLTNGLDDVYTFVRLDLAFSYFDSLCNYFIASLLNTRLGN